VDDKSPDFDSHVSDALSDLSGPEMIGVIGFATSQTQFKDPSELSREPEDPTEYYLKLVFTDEQAAYYQFDLFPDLNANYILGASRKRAGAVQHIHITLSGPTFLQSFIESCRSNPHFVRVEESTAVEFERAPSNAV